VQRHRFVERLQRLRARLALGGYVRLLVERRPAAVRFLDWSATGAGDRDRGPPVEACFDLATVQSQLLDAGFTIDSARERRETFVVTATFGRN
jgi:hypothetical protein